MEMKELDARQQLLVILMEECGELIQECSKNLRKSELFDRLEDYAVEQYVTGEKIAEQITYEPIKEEN